MSKPENPLIYNEEPLPGGLVSYSVTQIMSEPTCSPHVRGVAIYIPRQQQVPQLSIRIVQDAQSSPLAISSVKINEDVGGYMQIGIAAQQMPGAPKIAGVHHCNIVAIGRPIAGK